MSEDEPFPARAQPPMMAIYWPTLLWAKPDRQDTRSESDPPDRRN